MWFRNLKEFYPVLFITALFVIVGRLGKNKEQKIRNTSSTQYQRRTSVDHLPFSYKPIHLKIKVTFSYPFILYCSFYYLLWERYIWTYGLRHARLITYCWATPSASLGESRQVLCHWFIHPASYQGTLFKCSTTETWPSPSVKDPEANSTPLSTLTVGL